MILYVIEYETCEETGLFDSVFTSEKKARERFNKAIHQYDCTYLSSYDGNTGRSIKELERKLYIRK